MFDLTRQGAVDVVHGDEPLNHEITDEVRATLESIEKQGQPHVVFDLENVPLIDSQGLELLLDFQDSFSDRGGALKLAGPNSLCRNILKITKVETQIEIFDDVISAVGSFAQ